MMNEDSRNILRQRWELASVLNFLKVFEPVIGSNIKLSAKEIETALIEPNSSLAHLHVSILKGIPPVSKSLKDPDAWVVVLVKKLLMWWPWVAEGDFPLTAAKGAEMATYKELDPTVRLVILKALCEIRADQHDVVSYINDAIKTKKGPSTFRKSNIGEDGKGTSYWLEVNETIGVRLYKEVNTFKGKGTLPTISCQWETIATNLEEFQNVVDEYSSSNSKLEVAVRTAVETEAFPVLIKLKRKKQRELLKKKNEERVIHNFVRTGITRSCRSRRPISYTYDDYDKAISEAIRDTKRMKTRDELRKEKKETVANEDPEQEDHQPTDGKSTESDSESSKFEVEYVSEDYVEDSDENDEDTENTNQSSKEGKMKPRDEQRRGKKNFVEDSESEQEEGESTETDQEDGESTESDSEGSKLETIDVSDAEESGDESDENDEGKENTSNGSKENGSFADKIESKRITENGHHSIHEIRNFGTKKRLRQRPNRNTALESAIVLDSEDEAASEYSD